MSDGNGHDHDGRGRFAPGNRHAWKPGESGNPAGRPARASFEAFVEEILDEEVTHGEERVAALVATS